MRWFGRRRGREIDPAPLRAICAALPERFDYLRQQVEAGMILRIHEDVDGHQRVRCDTDLLNHFEDPKGRYFALVGIRVGEVPVEIRVTNGVIFQFKHDGVLDPSAQVDVSALEVKYLDSHGKRLLAHRLAPERAARVNPAHVYEMEINGESYLHLRDLDDGEVLAADPNGRIVRLSPHPFAVEPAEDEL